MCQIIDMETTVKHLYAHPLSAIHKESLWKKFINWCNGQEKYKLGWLGVAVTVHGCILTILTMFAVVLSGNHFIFWPFIIGAMGATLVVNLAALPTKITIPVFIMSVLIDAIIIALCIAHGLNMNSIY